MTRQTQKRLVLKLLMEHYPKFLPVWWFIGERHSEELGWVFLSHRAPARLTELFQEGYLERKRIKGKTGAYYYSYRFLEQAV